MAIIGLKAIRVYGVCLKLAEHHFVFMILWPKSVRKAVGVYLFVFKFDRKAADVYGFCLELTKRQLMLMILGLWLVERQSVLVSA